MHPNLAAFVLGATAPLLAQSPTFSVVAPLAAATVEGTTSTPLPFGSSLARHVLYAYDGSSVGYQTPIRITALDLRADGTTGGSSVAGSYSFALRCSTGRLPANALDTTFASNHGADKVLAYTGVLSTAAVPVGATPNAFGLRIPFANPFEWDPRNGPLVLEFIYNASTPSFGAFDAVGAPDLVGGLSASGASTTVATSVLTTAPVIRLQIDGGIAPPIAASTEGSSWTAYPWNPSSTGSRSLTLYEPAALPFTNRRWITALAWRTEFGQAFAGRTYTARISLSTSPVTATTLSTTFENNHGGDKTVVFDGSLIAPASPASTSLSQFDLYCELQRPFEYDPAAGPLVVDLQVFGATFGNSTFDVWNQAGSGVGRVSHTTSATATTTVGSATTSPQPGVALVMAIRSVPIAIVPSVSANATNPNANTTNYPFGISACRSLNIVAAADAGITQPTFVRHLRYRPSNTTVFGPTTWTCTIDVSNPILASATAVSTFDLNHGPNRLRVFDGQFSCAYGTRTPTGTGFPIEVKLQRPFLWDPGAFPYLTVDIVVSGRSGPGIGIETTNGLAIDDARVTGGATATTGSTQTIAAVMEIGGETANGLTISVGAGCAGTNGVPQCTTIGVPCLPNQDFRVRILQAAGNAPAILVLGLAAANLPIPGAPGCAILHGFELGSFGVVITDPSGDGSLAVPLPSQPGADGFQFRGQWAVLDQSANSLGVVISNVQLLTAKFF